MRGEGGCRVKIKVEWRIPGRTDSQHGTLEGRTGPIVMSTWSKDDTKWHNMNVYDKKPQKNYNDSINEFPGAWHGDIVPFELT